MAPQVEIISQHARFAEIAPRWDALWRRCSADVFQSHSWIAAWLDVFSRDVRPCIAVAWQGEELVAAIPLAIRRRLGLRCLEWAAQSFSDYCDALAAADAISHLPELWNAVWRGGGFDLVKVEQIKPEAIVRRVFDEDKTCVRRRDGQISCYGINCVGSDSEAWFRSLGKKGRNNFWRGERILASLGGEVQLHIIDPRYQPIDAELRHVLALKRASLQAAKRASVLLGRDGEALETMLRAVATAGQMRLFVLTCGDKMAAASVNFLCGDRMQAYLTSFDPAFERASPGMILIVSYTRWAFDQGLRIVDFLRGDEAFKVRLANCEVSLQSYLGARTLLGHAAIASQEWRSRSANEMAAATSKPLDPQLASSLHLSGES
jgi:CelD/BcsL family acetyltransferase involved in cellulose biosynthesis